MEKKPYVLDFGDTNWHWGEDNREKLLRNFSKGWFGIHDRIKFESIRPIKILILDKIWYYIV